MEILIETQIPLYINIIIYNINKIQTIICIFYMFIVLSIWYKFTNFLYLRLNESNL